MHTDHKREDPLVEMGYEVRDIDVPSVAKAAMGFFAFAIGSYVVGWFIYRYMHPEPFNVPVKPAFARRLPLSPNPLLQSNVTAKTDIADLRQAESGQLSTTGPSAIDATKSHIPIDRAMRILAERGLPVITSNEPAVTKGNTTDEKKR